MAKPTCWVELRYGWGLKGIAIAQSGNPKLLRQTKEVMLAEAERKAQITKRVDSILALIEQEEFNRLRRILEVLIPEDKGNNQ